MRSICFLSILISALCTCLAQAAQADADKSQLKKTGNNSHFYELDSPTVAIQPLPIQPLQNKGTYSEEERYRLLSGDKISEVLALWCKSNGWTLVWDASEIISEADADVNGKFELAVGLVLDALNRNGAKVRAVFYDTNRILRVTEKK